MGELGLNKIIGAVLATALGLMLLMELPGMVFGGAGGHYGDDHAQTATLSETMCKKFSYCIEIAEASGGAAAAVEEVFDLGAALLAAELSRGERLFASQCSTCHTITPGGANGTGPNLYNTVGADKAHIAGFNYSGALTGAEGSWTYENLDGWLKNPASYLRGTSMSFAGIRRDGDRAAVIAYLAANTENPPAFPAPLAQVSDEQAAAEGAAVETGAESDMAGAGDDAAAETGPDAGEATAPPAEAPAVSEPETAADPEPAPL